MIAPTQIRKPENWQDFEKLCKKLWGEIWKCPDSIKRNGRSGQNQCGIDVYGLPQNEVQYYGIQCKGKDDYSKSQLSTKEIDEEVSKALNFKPQLKKMIFATTANKDVGVEEYIRVKNVEHITQSLFEIDICSWEDIVDLLEERRDTYNWYINNCQYKDCSDIEVFLNWEREFEIYPEYIRTTKIYHEKIVLNNPLFNIDIPEWQKSLMEINHQSSILYRPWDQKSKVDYRWCTIPVNLKNTGSTVIEDYKLYLIFDSDKIISLDDKFRYFHGGVFANPVVVSQENISREKQQEIFLSSEYKNVIEYIPLKNILVQDDEITFKIGVKPQNNVNDIGVKWILRSRDYQKEGNLNIKVIPQFEDKKEYIEVENEEDLKDNEVTIEPKIVEE